MGDDNFGIVMRADDLLLLIASFLHCTFSEKESLSALMRVFKSSRPHFDLLYLFLLSRYIFARS